MNIPLFKQIVRNKLIIYIFSRYATYFIQFINSLFIAVYLGPYYLGIWGFISLIIQYLNQFNFGISHSANAIISLNKNHIWYVNKVIGTSISILIVLSLFVIFLYSVNEVLELGLGSKYNFSMYAPAVLIIGILAYFNTLFSNIFRVYGRLFEIAINQSAFPVLMLIVIAFFEGRNLLWALVAANFLAFFLSLILYLFRTPIKIRPILNGRLIKTIQIKGWHLFVYNTSFYLIIISTKSFVSAFYSVEEFGYFTFAFSLATVIQLLLQSFSFLIFPKVLNRLGTASKERGIGLIVLIRNMYITTSHLLIHIAFLFIPGLFVLFPEYNQSVKVFKLIALTIVLYSNSFGYSGLLIAKRCEKLLGLLSVSALVVNVSLAWLLISIFKVPYTFVIVATMFSYFLFVYGITFFGRQKLELDSSFVHVFNDSFPLKLFIPYLLSFVFVISEVPYFAYGVSFGLFLLFNWDELLSVKRIGRDILLKPDIINI